MRPDISTAAVRPGFELSVAELRGRGGKKWHTYGEDVLPAWIADMDFRPADAVREAVLDIARAGDFTYRPDTMLRLAADTLADRMRAKFGWEIDPDRVIVLADLVQGLTATVLAYSAPGDGIAVLTPIYPPFVNVLSNTGRRLVAVPMTDTSGGFTVDLDALEQALQPADVTVLLLCNPHNPTGRVLTRAELSAIDGLAARHGVIVVSDEIHAELVYAPRQHTVTATVSPTAATRTVTLQSATKTFNLGSLRCGFVHFGSEELHRQFDRAIPDRLLGRVSGVSIAATVAAWLDADDWLAQVLRQLAANRDRVTQWVAAQDGRVHAHAPEATYFSWLRLHGVSREPAADLLLRDGRVALHPGQQFAPECSSWVRLNFATTPEILDDILARVSSALSAHQVSISGGNT